MRSTTDAAFNASATGNDAICQICKTQMALKRREPRPLGYEFRVFECVSCNVEHQIFVSLDPVKLPFARSVLGEKN